MSRVLFVDQYGDIGGGQTVLLSLIRAAIKTGAKISVLAPGGGALQAAIQKEFSDTVAFIACEEPRLTHGRKGVGDLLSLLAYGWRFRTHLPLLHQQDVIWVNGLRHLPHLLRMSRKLSARFIYHVHIAHSALERMLLRRAAFARQTFRLVVNSRFVADNLGVADTHLSLIENALDLAFAGRVFIDRFQKAGTSTGAVIGTVRPEKGQDIAARAAAGILTLHVIGRDGDGAQDWIADLKRSAGSGIYFDGAVTDVPSRLDALNIQFNLVPSRWQEPFGLVAIEGMACSCLTIVSGTGGLEEIAEKTGALVAPDEASLAAMLSNLCARPPAELSSLARRQFEATQRHYAPARFETAVQELLHAAASAPSIHNL
jgi:glycosyltransferase involved in cell wall biosynthesis